MRTIVASSASPGTQRSAINASVTASHATTNAAPTRRITKTIIR